MFPRMQLQELIIFGLIEDAYTEIKNSGTRLKNLKTPN